MPTYLNYVVSTQPLKGVPDFDSQIEGINNGSGENEEFGDYALDKLFQWITKIVAQ